MAWPRSIGVADMNQRTALSDETTRMSGARAVVTGGAGVVGSHIVDLLVADGASHVVVLDKLVRGRIDNLAPALESGRVSVVEEDIRDRDAVAAVIDGADLVFHQAALRITLCAEEPRLALEVMAGGTFNVLEACVHSSVNKVVLASSAAVYGAADLIPTPENQHPYNDRTLYGALKSFDESLLRSFHEMFGLKYVALRYFNVYGPRMDIHGPHTEVLVRWMERIERGDSPLIMGDGLQTADFVFVEDVARANLLAAFSEVEDDTFNVGTGIETSLNELATNLARVMGNEPRLEFGEERSVNPVRRRLADTTKASRMLGFDAKVTLEEGLHRLVAWWRAERNRNARVGSRAT
jgi:UDP-glucose 4-epimerase